MSRKTHRSPNTMPRSSSPRPAVHHRRKRGIRHFRKSASGQAAARKARNSIPAAPQTQWAWDSATACMWIQAMLLGVATTMIVAGIHLNLGDLLASPFAPGLRAVHLLPLAILLVAVLSAVGPSLLPAHLSVLMPVASTTTIGLAGLFTGLAAAALPFLLSELLLAGDWIHAHFVLSDWLLRFLQLSFVLLICCLPVFGLGLTACLMHTLNRSNRERSWSLNSHALGLGVLLGIVLGILAAVLLAARVSMLLSAACLPMLVFAMIGGKVRESTPACASTNQT